ncbi:MAG: fibrinogen-like YCDxxxxGGGW domain-containing protein [Nocardioidaceae bacterium]
MTARTLTACARSILVAATVAAACLALPPAAVSATTTGATADTAAASCWDVKQQNPSATSGSYWLLTPAMSAPAQFWCDQTTDGGGWVKVGAGREGWETLAVGRGSAATLLQATPAANTQTTQLSASVIDGLLNGAPVTSLTDGVRVRRAANVTGTSWQEVRLRTSKPVGWFWSFGGAWPLTSWTVGSSTGTTGSSATFGSGASTLRVNTSIGTDLGYTWGFSYGLDVTGLSSPTSYLWTPTNGQGNARPFAEVYVRPRITSAGAGFSAIPDGGTPRTEKPVVPDSTVLTNPWGVTGIAGAVDQEGDVEVQAMTRIGSTMFVGGNFASVQQDAARTGRVSQPFLAAFNADTGAFVPTFRPAVNEAVQSLTALPDGRLAVGGKFTRVNGTAVTGLAVLNASTGALTPGWRTTLVNNVSPGTVRVLTLTTGGGYLYVGGTFTHTTGPNGTPAYARNLMRLDLTTFNPDTTWRPVFNSSVQDVEISEDGSRAYVVGFFTAMSGATATSAAALMTSSPARLDPAPWTPVWSAAKSYQQGVEQVGNRVFTGGSEHNLFSFDTGSYARLTTQINNPKGDTQVIVADDQKAFLWAGSHSNNFTYQGATTWPGIGTAWTRADTIGWVGVWRLSDVSPVSTFTPTLRSRLGSGAWAVAQAGNGTMWVGGDFQQGRGSGNVTRWTGAFVRFGMTDGAAPSTPTGLRVSNRTATTVTLAWTASAGGLGGGTYQVLRNDRPIATTTGASITVPLDGGNRFFVRAADSTGNVSASTPVLVVSG